MRTTVIIDDELLRRARKRAAEAGLTLSDVVNRALRESFAQQAPAEPAPPFRMVTFGGGRRVDHRPADFARLLEEDDRAGVRRR